MLRSVQLTVLLTLVLSAPASAQDQPVPHGMRTWQLAILRRGPEYHKVQGTAREALFKRHFANMGRLHKLGKLRLAGPLGAGEDAPKDAYAGLFLLDVKSREEALELCKSDPTIKAKVFTVDLLTWFGPKGISFPRALFNGMNLKGWHPDIPRADNSPDLPPSFVAKDGLLISQGRPQGHLITDESFHDYRLVVEYRWPGKPGNCGVLVHASTPRMLYKMFPQSIECQMHHTNAGDFWCIGENVKVPDMVKRRGAKEKWGVVEGKARRIRNLTDGSEQPLQQWNQMVIECRGRRIDVWVNGDHVNNGFDCTADRGQIAIQAEGAVCEFRKIELTPLPELPKPNK